LPSEGATVGDRAGPLSDGGATGGCACFPSEPLPVVLVCPLTEESLENALLRPLNVAPPGTMLIYPSTEESL